jgi:hypothetical protein
MRAMDAVETPTARGFTAQIAADMVVDVIEYIEAPVRGASPPPEEIPQ